MCQFTAILDVFCHVFWEEGVRWGFFFGFGSCTWVAVVFHVGSYCVVMFFIGHDYVWEGLDGGYKCFDRVVCYSGGWMVCVVCFSL